MLLERRLDYSLDCYTPHCSTGSIMGWGTLWLLHGSSPREDPGNSHPLQWPQGLFMDFRWMPRKVSPAWVLEEMLGNWR